MDIDELTEQFEVAEFDYKSQPDTVYFLVDDKEVVYVGRTRHLTKRSEEHKNGHTNRYNNRAHKMIFDKVYYIRRIWDSGDAGIIERAFIELLQPKYNVQHRSYVRTVRRVTRGVVELIPGDKTRCLKTIQFELSHSKPVG